MLKVQIGTLEFEVATHRDTTNEKVMQTLLRQGEDRRAEVNGAAQTAETKAALKAILAYIS